MTDGCELFIAGHEYVNAVSGHQNAKRDSAMVEVEADRMGARIALQRFVANGMNAVLAAASICLFFEAIEADHHAGPHPCVEERVKIEVQSLSRAESWTSMAHEIAELFAIVFDDMLAHAS